MQTIPMIRERLHQLAEELSCPELADLAEETKRRPYVRKAPTRHGPVSPATQDAIRRYAADHPEAHQQDIATRFGVNAGRVSETLAGFR